MILQSVWWMCVKISIHMEIQTSYEILWLDSSKHVIMRDKFACFDKGSFLAVFGIEEPHSFRG